MTGNLSEELDRWAREYVREPSAAKRSSSAARGGNTAGSTRRGWAESGHKGAYYTAQGRWQGRFRHRGVLYHCGNHDTAEQAAEAVAARKAELSEAPDAR